MDVPFTFLPKLNQSKWCIFFPIVRHVGDWMKHWRKHWANHITVLHFERHSRFLNLDKLHSHTHTRTHTHTHTHTHKLEQILDFRLNGSLSSEWKLIESFKLLLLYSFAGKDVWCLNMTEFQINRVEEKWFACCWWIYNSFALEQFVSHSENDDKSDRYSTLFIALPRLCNFTR